LTEQFIHFADGLKQAAESTIQTLQSFEISLNNISSVLHLLQNDFKYLNMSAVIKKSLDKVWPDSKKYIMISLHGVLQSILNEVANCNPYYEPVAILIDAVCVKMLDPVNGICFGLGWALMFFLPAIIFAVKLNNLYRTNEPYSNFGSQRESDRKGINTMRDVEMMSDLSHSQVTLLGKSDTEQQEKQRLMKQRLKIYNN